MQKAPVMKGSGLIPLEESKLKEEVHVFGKNLEERVITEPQDSPSISFTNIPNKRPTEDDDNIDSIRKRKFEAITGEEDEETVFQSDFKLFSWDLTTSNWIEKGRGQLKLNDSATDDENEKKSRLIMRVNGTLRIILNIAIYRPLFRVIVSTKNNIRFTDGQTVWAASGSYADKLNRLIEERIVKQKQRFAKQKSEQCYSELNAEDEQKEELAKDGKKNEINREKKEDNDRDKEDQSQEKKKNVDQENEIDNTMNESNNDDKKYAEEKQENLKSEKKLDDEKALSEIEKEHKIQEEPKKDIESDQKGNKEHDEELEQNKKEDVQSDHKSHENKYGKEEEERSTKDNDNTPPKKTKLELEST